MSGALPYNEINSFITTTSGDTYTVDTNQNAAQNQSKPNIGMRDMIHSTAFDQRRKSIENYKTYKNVMYKSDS